VDECKPLGGGLFVWESVVTIEGRVKRMLPDSRHVIQTRLEIKILVS
jgi:hypothetical protein